MFIDIWGQPGVINGIYPLLKSWQDLQDPSFDIRFVEPDLEYIQSLNSLHPFIRRWRTIIKVNDKHVFFDGTERRGLASESNLLPFDLIIKGQYHKPKFYAASIAPVSPFVYTLNSYDMQMINKYRKIRQQCMKDRTFASSMFWSGSLYTNKIQRWAVKIALDSTRFGDSKKKPFEAFYNALARTQVGIVPAGGGDFTHRELELESVGTPYFRKTYNLQTYKPRIPNVHYYSIGGDEVGINKILKHFIDYFEPNGEYRNFTDEEWEQYCDISRNSLAWFDSNAGPQGSFNNFKEILEKHSIL